MAHGALAIVVLNSFVRLPNLSFACGESGHMRKQMHMAACDLFPAIPRPSDVATQSPSTSP